MSGYNAHPVIWLVAPVTYAVIFLSLHLDCRHQKAELEQE